MPEAKLEQTEHGLVPQDDGWFMANAREMPWARVEGLGSAWVFEGDQRFPSSASM